MLGLCCSMQASLVVAHEFICPAAWGILVPWLGIKPEAQKQGTFAWRQCMPMAPHSSTLAWKIHGRRSLVGCSPRGCWESETTERLHFQFSLSCIGEGNGNPLQCSCLENPRDRGAWWAAVYGVVQSWTRLKRLSSSSSSSACQVASVVSHSLWPHGL